MKKILIVILALILLLTGLFFWKGGHHAVYLADVLTDWLEADIGDQSLTIGRTAPQEGEFSLTADTFWTAYGDKRVYGLSIEGITAYLRGNDLYLDSGKAYALPEMPELENTLERLSLGLLLYGRVTKDGDTYHITMDTKELQLSAAVTVDGIVQAVTVRAAMPDETVINAALTSRAPLPHPIPQAVADAMDQPDPPMSLTEPLEVLLPAAENLLPLSGDLKLGVSCGILELSETVRLDLGEDKTSLTRNGKSLDLELPMNLMDVPPVVMTVLLLREGEFTRTEDGALFSVKLSAASATALLNTLIPQAEDLGITLENSSLNLHITGGSLISADLSANGSVPFLFTSIPVDFSAELTIS